MQRSPDSPHTQRRAHIALAMIILLGALLRLYFLFASQWLIEGDEAAVGLQALHILRGERPIFFPGQAYLGNLESYLVAVVFELCGVSRYSLKLVPFVFALVFIFLCFQIGKEIFDDERVALLSALLAALAPVYFVMWSVKARGGFIEALVVAQLAWLWAHRWLAPPSDSSHALQAKRQPTRTMSGLIFGFSFGYGLWMNPLVVYVLAPLGIVSVWHALSNFRAWRGALVPGLSAACGALFGALPWLLYRTLNGREAFRRIEHDVPPVKDWWPLTQRVWQYFWQDGLPTLMGLRLPRQAFNPDWRLVVMPLFALALLWLLWRARRSRGALLLALMALVAFPIFNFGSITGGNFAVIIPDSGLLTRYLLPLYILLLIALGLLLARLPIATRGLALVSLLVVNLWSVFGVNAVPLAHNEFSNQPLPASNAELINFLEQQSLHYVFTNHWIGYPVMLESREQIFTFDYSDVKFDMDRFPDYSQQVARAGHPALVVFNPHYEPNPIDAKLKNLTVTYKKQELTDFIVYYDFAPYVHPSLLDDILQWPYY